MLNSVNRIHYCFFKTIAILFYKMVVARNFHSYLAIIFVWICIRANKQSDVSTNNISFFIEFVQLFANKVFKIFTGCKSQILNNNIHNDTSIILLLSYQRNLNECILLSSMIFKTIILILRCQPDDRI